MAENSARERQVPGGRPSRARLKPSQRMGKCSGDAWKRGENRASTREEKGPRSEWRKSGIAGKPGRGPNARVWGRSISGRGDVQTRGLHIPFLRLGGLSPGGGERMHHSRVEKPARNRPNVKPGRKICPGISRIRGEFRPTATFFTGANVC